MSKRFEFSLFVSLFLFLITPATSSGVEEIKIASTGPAVSTLPLEIAARKGFFRDEGLEILTITMRTNIAVNALITRNVKHGAKWQTLDWRDKLLIISDLPNGA